MVYLINLFDVYEGKEAGFLELWRQTSEIFAASDGFIHATLLGAEEAAMAGLEPRHSHINVAIWQGAEHYLAALANPRIKRLGPRYAAVSSYRPALYRPLITLEPATKS